MSFVNGIYAEQAQSVLNESNKNRKRNTQLAYDPKVEEFKLFCEYKYSTKPFPHCVTEEKVFGFLYFQAYRDLRRRGPQFSFKEFDVAGYERVMSGYKSSKPIEYDQLNQYLCSLLKLWRDQKDMGSNNVLKEDLRSDRVERLLEVVKHRKKNIDKENFEEKLESDFIPFLQVERIPLIEQELFNRHCNAPLFSLGSLRDRFCFLLSTFGILRGESLFKADLSDLCDFIKANDGLHICHVLVLRIAMGKTNGLKTLYGRVMRHSNVFHCPIGGLAFYLFARFHILGETIDFSTNNSWFNVKLLIESGTRDNTKAVSDQTYAKVMKKICEKLKISTKHFIHFGRGVGALKAELDELDSHYIKNLGNWNPDTQESVYSAKMPMKALRVMAGHSEKKDLFFLPRSGVTPPEDLQKKIFPFIEEALEKTESNRVTTMEFLRLLKRLRIIILQDSAVLINSGRTHFVFQNEIFKSDGFKVFSSELLAYVKSSKDPSTSSFENVLPGICTKIDNVENHISGNIAVLKEYISNSLGKISKDMEDLKSNSYVKGLVRHIGNFQFENDVENTTPDVSLKMHQKAAAPPSFYHSYPPYLPSSNSIDFNYTMYQGHKNATSLWNEWYGLNQFSSLNNPLCYSGGIDALEKSSKERRNKFQSKESKYFSRAKYIITYINNKIENGFSLNKILEDLDKLMETKTITSLEAYLKKN
jgi:hypothetical protein